MSTVVNRFAKHFGGWELCDGIDADFCRRGSNSAYTRKARPRSRSQTFLYNKYCEFINRSQGL